MVRSRHSGPAGASLVGLLFFGCADLDVGLAIPEDQLYYPHGIAVLEGEESRLAVLSTNFDQRFQTGQVSLLDPGVLVDIALDALGPGAPCGSANRPLFLAGFRSGPRDAVRARARVPGVGAELLAVPSGADQTRIFVTDRLQSSLLYVERDGDTLRCRLPDETPLGNTDCGESHLSITESEEPFALARGVGPGGSYVAVGHLFGHVTATGRFGVLSLFDEAQLVAKSRGAEATPLLAAVRLEGTGGASGVASTPSAPGASGEPGLLVLSGTPDLPRQVELSSVAFRPRGGGEQGSIPARIRSLRLDRAVNAVTSRGLRVTPDGRRAAISVRFEEPGGVGFNAGVTMVDLTSSQLDFAPAVEFGEEIGPPAFRPTEAGGPLYGYFGDIRLDKVWIVDLTRDVPRVVGEIVGRDRRVLPDGQVITARSLDGPTGIDFFRQGDRTYAFVTNFANSTLALLDVSSPVAREHCLLARFGRDLDADGESEEDRR